MSTTDRKKKRARARTSIFIEILYLSISPPNSFKETQHPPTRSQTQKNRSDRRPIPPKNAKTPVCTGINTPNESIDAMAIIDTPTRRQRTHTTILINAASVLEKCEEQILPALYSRVGASFGATPTQLGNITLARSFMQALASPLAGIATHLLPRSHIIFLGCLIWSIFTILFALTNSVAAALPLCAINGIGLALVIPSVQSLTADYHPAEARGKAFGALWLTISFGGMLGALYATNVGATRPFGMEGWRFVFISVATASILVGILNARYVFDPTWSSNNNNTSSAMSPQQELQQHQGGGGGGGGMRANNNTIAIVTLSAAASDPQEHAALMHHHHHHHPSSSNATTSSPLQQQSEQLQQQQQPHQQTRARPRRGSALLRESPTGAGSSRESSAGSRTSDYNCETTTP